MTTEMTAWQRDDLRRYADGEPHRFETRPGWNLIRRNLLTLAPAAGPGHYRITEYGRAVLEELPLPPRPQPPLSTLDRLELIIVEAENLKRVAGAGGFAAAIQRHARVAHSNLTAPVAEAAVAAAGETC